MSHWIVVGREGCPVAGYVTQVVSEEETGGETHGEGALRRWVVEACEGQIQQLMADPRIVSITWEKR